MTGWRDVDEAAVLALLRGAGASHAALQKAEGKAGGGPASDDVTTKHEDRPKRKTDAAAKSHRSNTEGAPTAGVAPSVSDAPRSRAGGAGD